MKIKILSLMVIGLMFMGCVATLRSINPHLYPPTVKERKAYIEANPQLTLVVKTMILGGEVIIGMTQDEVKASRGRPYKVNRTSTAYGIREQWVMGPMDFMAHIPKKCKQYFYIYFENGIVTSLQNW